MVQYNGQWGTVCDDDFGSREANTACRAMGYTGAKRHSSSRRESQYRGQFVAYFKSSQFLRLFDS